MQLKKNWAFLFALLFFVPTQTITRKQLIVGSTLTFIAALTRFFTKRPMKNAPTHYSTEFKDYIIKPNEIMSVDAWKKWVTNILYVVDEAIIGRPGNASRSLRADKDGKIDVKELSWPQGLFGWAYWYSIPFRKALTFSTSAMIYYLSLIKGRDIYTALMSGDYDEAALITRKRKIPGR